MYNVYNIPHVSGTKHHSYCAYVLELKQLVLTMVRFKSPIDMMVAKWCVLQSVVLSLQYKRHSRGRVACVCILWNLMVSTSILRHCTCASACRLIHRWNDAISDIILDPEDSCAVLMIYFCTQSFEYWLPVNFAGTCSSMDCYCYSVDGYCRGPL